MIILCCVAAFAAEPVETQAGGVQPKLTTPGGFTFLGQAQIHATVSNLDSTNPFLDGQVLGRIGGPNGIVPNPEVTAAYTEERVSGFFTYAPPSANGLASLTAAFEVDFAFGDQSYGTGGNTGGAFGADQVNLQTRRLHADLRPKLGDTDFHVIAGLQFVGDSVSDPTASSPDGLMRSGGRLQIFGSEAAGLAVYGRLHDDWGDRFKFRAGAFTLYEQGMSAPDDLTLMVGDVEYRPAYATAIGLHAWYLQDRTGGDVGALGVGTSSALSDLQGGPQVDPWEGHDRPQDAIVYADVVWTGVDASYNADLRAGPVGVSGVALVDLGRIYANQAPDDRIGGYLLNVEARGRYAPGEGSIVRAEALLTGADDDDPDAYSGMLTGNTWGFAGAVPSTHGTMLLLGDPRSINRLVAVVSDVSGAGQGVRALTGSFGYDLVPDRLNATVGVGTATNGRSQALGTEVNGRLVYRPAPLLDLGLYGAVVSPGAASGLDAAPWMTQVAMDWVVF